MGRGRGHFGGHGHHHHHSRSGPSMDMLERLSMPQSGARGYFFPYVNGAYDTSSFRAEYSNNTISSSEVSSFVGDINNIPEVRTGAGCASCLLAVLPIFIFLAMGGGLALIFTNIDYPQQYFNGNGYVYAPSGTGGMGVEVGIAWAVSVFVIGISLIVLVCCYLKGRINNIAAAMTEKINEVITRHTNGTFAGKEVILRVSTYRTYVAIEFKKPMVLPGDPNAVPGMGAAKLFGGGGFQVANL